MLIILYKALCCFLCCFLGSVSCSVLFFLSVLITFASLITHNLADVFITMKNIFRYYHFLFVIVFLPSCITLFFFTSLPLNERKVLHHLTDKKILNVFVCNRR